MIVLSIVKFSVAQMAVRVRHRRRWRSVFRGIIVELSRWFVDDVLVFGLNMEP